jgi:hypothetical protein
LLPRHAKRSPDIRIDLCHGKKDAYAQNRNSLIIVVIYDYDDKINE